MSELAHEPRLARAGLAGQQDEGAFPSFGPRERGAQRRQLLRAADEWEPRGRHERARERHLLPESGGEQSLPLELERRVVDEDRSFEPLQSGARLEPELVA